MKSFLKMNFGVAAGTICSLVFAQALLAQSGSRSNEYQLPVPSSQIQETYGTWQGSGQRSEVLPYPSRETRPREVVRVGFGQYDHRALDNLLQKYVDSRGDVDYATWQTDQKDRAALLSYLRGMNSLDPAVRSSLASEMAFWINAYNALTIEGILQLFPTRSIKDHAPDANGFNIWDDFKLPVGGSEYSLNDIEHKILRKMGDPRIHFAIVCASKGCPQLSQRAYFADSLDQQLAYSAGLFFHTPEKFSYDVGRGQLGLSPIIKWFADDFGRSDQERLQYLAQFMPAEAGRLAASGSATISYLNYDWNLNLAPARRPVSNQNFVPVQSLRAQGSTTRQSPRQDFYSQTPSAGQQTETYRPVRPAGQCGQGGCRRPMTSGYGASW